MNYLFVDTSGWMALADADDPHHNAARVGRDDWLRRGGLLVSSNYVMDETLTLLRVRLNLEAAARWWRQIESSPRFHWEWIDTARSQKALEWFLGWSDKRFSFTDCTSFVIMRELGLRQALTTDRHFVQAGFETIPLIAL